jgi:hypothetical protein
MDCKRPRRDTGPASGRRRGSCRCRFRPDRSRIACTRQCPSRVSRSASTGSSIARWRGCRCQRRGTDRKPYRRRDSSPCKRRTGRSRIGCKRRCRSRRNRSASRGSSTGRSRGRRFRRRGTDRKQCKRRDFRPCRCPLGRRRLACTR